jgi:hypothetical protein
MYRLSKSREVRRWDMQHAWVKQELYDMSAVHVIGEHCFGNPDVKKRTLKRT